MKMPEKLTIGNCVPILLTLVSIGVAAICMYSVNALNQANGLVDFTHKAIADARLIEAAAVDMETGLRGYLLTGNERFRAPYNRGEISFNEKLDGLTETLSINPDQVKLLSEIDETISKWIAAEAVPMFAIREEAGSDARMAEISTYINEAHGQQHFDKFREQIATLIETEQTLMNERQENATSLASTAWYVILFGTIVIVALANFASFALRRSITAPLRRSATELQHLSKQRLAAVGQRLNQSATETSTRAGTVSNTSDDLRDSAEAVQEAVSQMEASIREIADNASMAAGVASEAVSAAEQSSVAIQELGERADHISDMTNMIKGIAEQTSLLALNATIEAARAGESGKGFAVVAHEVKELSRKTNQSTEDIVVSIVDIQKGTEKAVAAINRVTEVIRSISENQSSIASAVEEQSAVTSEISQSISKVANGSNEIAEGIAFVVQKAGTTTDDSTATLQTATDIESMANELLSLVGEQRQTVEV